AEKLEASGTRAHRLQRRSHTVPTRKNRAALRPGEYPRNRAERFEAARTALDGPRSDGETGDGVDRRRGSKERGEPRLIPYERAIGASPPFGELAIRVEVALLVVALRMRLGPQRVEERAPKDELEGSHGESGSAVFVIERFALLCRLVATADAASGKRE